MLSVKIIGGRKLALEFTKIGKGLNDFTKPLTSSTKYMQKEVQKNFPAKGKVLKSPWEPRRYHYSHPVLNKSGKMKKNFKQDINKDRSIISNPTPYFKYHQKGVPKRNLDQRVMLRFSDTQSRKITNIFNDWFGRLI